MTSPQSFLVDALKRGGQLFQRADGQWVIQPCFYHPQLIAVRASTVQALVRKNVLRSVYQHNRPMLYGFELNAQ